MGELASLASYRGGVYDWSGGMSPYLLYAATGS